MKRVSKSSIDVNKVFQLLEEERPLIVKPTLAKEIGLNEAIILQQIKYWITNKRNENIYDGKKWVYKSYEEWREEFPFWGLNTIQRAITSLENQGLIISKQLGKLKMDRRKWYTINLTSSTTPKWDDDHTKMGWSATPKWDDVLYTETTHKDYNKDNNVDFVDLSCSSVSDIVVGMVNKSAQIGTVNEIFDYWKEIMKHPNAKLDDKRRRSIQKALKDYPAEKIKEAILGCSRTPFNMGDNDRGTIYDDITLILRDSKHVEEFIRHCHAIPKGKKKNAEDARRDAFFENRERLKEKYGPNGKFAHVFRKPTSEKELDNG